MGLVYHILIPGGVIAWDVLVVWVAWRLSVPRDRRPPPVPRLHRRASQARAYRDGYGTMDL